MTRALSPEVLELRSPRAIRQRAGNVLQAGLDGRLEHFGVNLDRLAEAARITAEVTRARYPDLRIPPHSRFAHFDAGGIERNARIARELEGLDPLERARRLADLVVVSVLLDAGAGATWRYREQGSGQTFARSEGLAVASLDWARGGALSSRAQAYAVDADRLAVLDAANLESALQVRADNPLVGALGRLDLLRSLGQVLRARPDVFGDDARIGCMIDRLHAEAVGGELPAERILALVLEGLGAIWPGRLQLDGAPLGDVWRHPDAGGEGKTKGMLPLHKLSQWLSYSLIHPLEVSGLRVTELDALTGLAEYRNGGLFVDSGVLVPKHMAVTHDAHAANSETIVEWRALTVALLDRLAPLVREQLGVSAEQLPLAGVLEGGTWAAGRKLANALRPPLGEPPIRVLSDGTVF